MRRFNSTISIKYGCDDCPPGNNKPIKARGKCEYHYAVFSIKARQDKKRLRAPEEPKDTIWEFYQQCVKQANCRCCECGDRVSTNEKNAHWTIAHVLPKKHFDSIKTNDDNWIELCYGCHVNYDRYIDEHDERLTQMRIFPLVIEKIKLLLPHIKEHRRLNNLPIFILNQIVKTVN